MVLSQDVRVFSTSLWGLACKVASARRICLAHYCFYPVGIQWVVLLDRTPCEITVTSASSLHSSRRGPSCFHLGWNFCWLRTGMKVLGVRSFLPAGFCVKNQIWFDYNFLTFSFFSKNCMLAVFSEFKAHSLVDGNIGRGRDVITALLSHCNVWWYCIGVRCHFTSHCVRVDFVLYADAFSKCHTTFLYNECHILRAAQNGLQRRPFHCGSYAWSPLVVFKHCRAVSLMESIRP